jgi:hypothetical protein
MVATTDTIERAVVRRTTAGLMLGDLPEIAAEWDTLPEGERAAWSIEWDNEMAGLAQISPMAACGALTPDLYSRYRQLLAALGESAPIVSRLNLSLPHMLRDQ